MDSASPIVDSASWPDSASPEWVLGESERQEGPDSGFFDIYLMETCLYHIRSTLIRFFDIYDYNLDLIKDIYQLINYLISLYDN